MKLETVEFVRNVVTPLIERIESLEVQVSAQANEVSDLRNRTALVIAARQLNKPRIARMGTIGETVADGATGPERVQCQIPSS